MTGLRFQVVDQATGCIEELALHDHEWQLLELQRQRHFARGVPEAFSRWLADALGAVLADRVDYELRAPSKAQVEFALAMARKLRVDLPAEALRFRGAMHTFLDMHKAAFNERRSTRGSHDQVE